MTRTRFWLGAAMALMMANAPADALADTTILNVSYDPTRELYQEFNAAFAEHWKQRPARTSPSRCRTAAPASRRARSSTASKPTS